MTIKPIKAEELGKKAGEATKATLKVASEVGKVAGQTAITPIGKKIVILGVSAIIGTVLSMVYLTDGSDFFGLKTNLLVGAIFSTLVYLGGFGSKKSVAVAIPKEPNFEVLTDKEKALLKKNREQTEFLLWKARR